MGVKLVIVGAGGHGREVADIARDRARCGRPVELLGFVDEDPRLRGKTVAGAPVLGDWSWFEGRRRRGLSVVCAVGDPRGLRRLAATGERLGLRFESVVSPRAYVSPSARLGAGVILFPNSVVNADASIGDHCTLNVGASVSHDCVVGDHVVLNPGARLAGNVRLGDGCFVGMGASVIQGLTVGAGARIGAGAVVVRDLPPGVTAVGVPAEPLKKRRNA